jgi:hypothetical protein
MPAAQGVATSQSKERPMPREAFQPFWSGAAPARSAIPHPSHDRTIRALRKDRLTRSRLLPPTWRTASR